MSDPASAWAAHLKNHQSRMNSLEAGGSRVPRPDDWICQICKPKVTVFASKAECFKCGNPKGAVKEEPPCTNFAVRGDNLLQTRQDGGSKSAKKTRNFKSDFDQVFWDVFGNSYVDYGISPGCSIKEITATIVQGSVYNVMCVGIGINDLLNQHTWDLVPYYPATLDADLEAMAAAIKGQAQGSVVMVGGPSKFWDRPPRFDSFMTRARNTLRKGGVQVVPGDMTDAAIDQMKMSSDGMHFANNDNEKNLFSRSWASWLLAAADPTWGTALDIEEEETRARSRSPRRAALDNAQVSSGFVSADGKGDKGGKGGYKGKEDWKGGDPWGKGKGKEPWEKGWEKGKDPWGKGGDDWGKGYGKKGAYGW